MRKILFVEVKSDVRSALNRLNTNWPQTRQDFAVDDVEENCHQEPCPTLEIPVKKKLIKTEARTGIQDSIFVYSEPILLIESGGWYRLTFLSLSVFRVTIYRPPSDVHLSGLQF